VRFKDGLTGRVRLHPEELTGALRPLRDLECFRRAYIDFGTVAGAGDIDLAPEEMYAQVAWE
jgi:hypothetical protein